MTQYDFLDCMLLVDDAVQRMKHINEEIRSTKKIPLAAVRNGVVPIVLDLAAGGSLISLFAALQDKDDYHYRHSIGVGVISCLIGSWLEIGRQDHLQLATAAVLHDVGKNLIPQHILEKPGKLSDDEYRLIKNHTVLGYNILKETVGINHRQALVALQHHERLDGSGYPFGLSHDKIVDFSRIVAVADVFHAMTSKRVYSDASPFYKVLHQMDRDTFGTLDPSITKLFINKIMGAMIGHSVELTDGSEGRIVMVQPHDPTHPLIQIDDQFIDLSRNQSLKISEILFRVES